MPRPARAMFRLRAVASLRDNGDDGNFGRSDYARKNGLDKMVGYIRSADDSKLEELMDILRFFDEWRASLEARPTLGGRAWKAYFITDHSWTDIRVCILGTVYVSIPVRERLEVQDLPVERCSPLHQPSLYRPGITCKQARPARDAA
ncbi:unnamed protein product [Ectocarpus sp. CCAP 1310/34]|nr:unnamed protein product [Ectocarpus sp. CCAP 1310/34]